MLRLLRGIAHQGHDAVDFSGGEAVPGVVRQAEVARRAVLHCIQRVPYAV